MPTQQGNPLLTGGIGDSDEAFVRIASQVEILLPARLGIPDVFVRFRHDKVVGRIPQGVFAVQPFPHGPGRIGGQREQAFAVQAGREVRIMVKPDVIGDDQVILLARTIARKIEESLDYPGQIKGNVIRESRAVEYAK